MNFKCPFCPRTFSQRLAYSQHTQICLRKVKVDEEESNSETYSIDLTQDINESDDNELMEYEPFQEAAQDTSFSSMESTYSNLLFEISIQSTLSKCTLYKCTFSLNTLLSSVPSLGLSS